MLSREVQIRNRVLTVTLEEGRPAEDARDHEVFGVLHDARGRRAGTVDRDLVGTLTVTWPNGTWARLTSEEAARLNEIVGARRMIGLPAWDDMCELDQGAALLHVWKRRWEGVSYAKENYPARYLVDQQLVALPEWRANRHAVTVAGAWLSAQKRLGVEEIDRLYFLALNEERRRSGHPLVTPKLRRAPDAA